MQWRTAGIAKEDMQEDKVCVRARVRACMCVYVYV